MNREYYIARMEEKGKHYKWKKYTDKQIFSMWNRLVNKGIKF